MYKDFSKDEIFVMIFMSIFAIAYRILYRYRSIPAKAAIIVFIICVGYLCFNRTIKFVTALKRNTDGFYRTVCTIRDIEYKPAGRGSYPVYIAHYTDLDDRDHIKEIHSSFSVKKWKIGDRIKIKVDRGDPDNIIIVFSDLSLAIIMSIMGVAVEIILFEIYIHMN